MHFCTNDTVILYFGALKIRDNIRCIRQYTSDTLLENMYDNNQHISTSYILLYYIKYWKKLYNPMSMEALTYIHIGCAHYYF